MDIFGGVQFYEFYIYITTMRIRNSFITHPPKNAVPVYPSLTHQL